MAKLVEGVIGEHLVRAFAGKVYYWKNKREVDFVVDMPNAFAPIEVKYQSRIISDDLKPLQSFGRGLLISRRDFRTESGFAVVPAALFLALLR